MDIQEAIKICQNEITNTYAENKAIAIQTVLNELDKKDKIINEYEKECKKTRAFARRIRKDEKRDIDQFNQGKEFASIQFLNLLSNEPHWSYEGKYFDEVDKEVEKYLKKAEGN